MHAEVFDVNVAAQARVEEQIPARVMVVDVDVDLVPVPFPVAAAVDVVGSNDPIGIVVQKEVASAVIKAARYKYFSHVGITPLRIGAAGADAIMVRLPVSVMRIVRIVPPLMFAVVMISAIPAILVAMLVPAFVLAPVMTLIAVTAVVAILRRRGQSGHTRQRHENQSCKESAHQCFLQRAKPAGFCVARLSRRWPARRFRRRSGAFLPI